ncbi:hypothetical protein AVEN_93431-1 [Araneus ventricosus]|uniref:Uncharacterized protein n=1 Tax=Araneus ventricosus TaxID=182803 RepID=A0A4Y2AP15_ARAVE|nr:hypothetical protein AVEN_93431-1 [Araneus ventricosus]
MSSCASEFSTTKGPVKFSGLGVERHAPVTATFTVSKQLDGHWTTAIGRTNPSSPFVWFFSLHDICEKKELAAARTTKKIRSQILFF